MRFLLSRILILSLLFVTLTTLALAQTAADPGERWQALNARVVQAYQAGDYASGSRLAEQAYELARETFGERHPATLGSLNNLAFLYQAQGRYGEAEPLYRQALQLSRKVFGIRPGGG